MMPLVTAMAIQMSEVSSAEPLPLSVVSASIEASTDQAEDIMTHFWDSFDFSDSSLTQDLVLIEEKFLEFINLMPYADEEKLPKLIYGFLDKANVDEATYSVIYNLAGKYLNDFDSPVRDEDYYILFLNHAVECGKLGEADKERAEFRQEMALKNRPGTQAPDFAVITRDGEKHNFTELLAEGYNILVFYDSDCNHCDEVLARISDEPILDGVNVLVIDAEEDRKLWETTCQKLPAAWKVGFSLDPIQDEETYILPEMPTVYLIDGDGKIILKETTLIKIIGVLSAADGLSR